MLPIILDKRKSAIRSGRAFNRLITYVEGVSTERRYQLTNLNQKFEDILNYTTQHQINTRAREKCIAIRTHGVTDISSAAIEMNAVASRNTRCEDPAFHFVLTWPEHERPNSDSIFDAAEHAIQSLGLVDHQYVLAIHVNTDNIHCHAAINRIHPNTFKSRNVEWAHRTIHLAARQSEIKHGWTHDNGIYIAKIDSQNNKVIVLNPEHDHAIPRMRRSKPVDLLPPWHDPESLESWLKTRVSKALKPELPKMDSWFALHTWLAHYGITLTDTGGYGMQIRVSSRETGEAVDLPASKGLRILKRSELEARWGKFTRAQLPDPSHSPVLAQHIGKDESETEKIGVSERDSSKRKERRDQRAEARADLRRRFSQYQRFVRNGDIDYFKRSREIRVERSQSLKSIHEHTQAANLAVRNFHRKNLTGSLLKLAAIHIESTRVRLEVEVACQEKLKSLRASRMPPLGWREWLYEQANLGDQAALSALRGIVYQARRDAKRECSSALHPKDDAETNEQQYRNILARLLDEERAEVAIRSARNDAVRPYEVDALLVQYIGMQWRVTGNGNVAYCDSGDRHLFTDRGNRITFDRECVSDEDIRLALVHAQQKFGKRITLTGDDPVFSARMACLADDLGMTVLNTELQVVLAAHRDKREQKREGAHNAQSAVNEPSPLGPSDDQASQSERHRDSVGEFELDHCDNPDQEPNLLVDQERLRAMVLAIDPRAKFLIPDVANSNRTYIGPIATILPAVSSGLGFAQQLGRGLYVLHPAKAPEHHNSANVQIQYRNGIAVVSLRAIGKGNEL